MPMRSPWPTATSVIKNATKEIAWQQGKAVTFMAKWDFGLAGSSSHIHMSLAKAGQERRSSTARTRSACRR